MPLGWTLSPRDPGRWGDYGQFLLYGMTGHLPRNDEGLLQHGRTGPFIPPMFMSSRTDLLVTDAAKRELEASDLEGFALRPVELAHVTRVDWQAWDTDADEPGFYPSSGEPEGFAIDGLHDADLARSMGPVWEVVLEPWATVPDADLASGTPEACEVRASFAAASWIGARYGEWIDAELRRPRR